MEFLEGRNRCLEKKKKSRRTGSLPLETLVAKKKKKERLPRADLWVDYIGSKVSLAGLCSFHHLGIFLLSSRTNTEVPFLNLVAFLSSMNEYL